jgi:hypothetical protein
VGSEIKGVVRSFMAHPPTRGKSRMGIAANLIPTLLDGVRIHGLSGSLLMLGRQEVTTDPSSLGRILAAEVFTSRSASTSWRTEGDYITPESFFGALGFMIVESLDVSDAEGAQIVFDLNTAHMPAELKGRCDVLFDGGTLEHVFHLPNALARCADMIKDDGWFAHVGPLNNYADHGFYQFSPTFWFDWFAANGWRMLESVLVRLPSSNRTERSSWSYSFLPPDRLGRVGQLDDAPCMHFLLAKKEPGAVADRIPMQAIYARRYRNAQREERELRDFAPYMVTDGLREAIMATPVAMR